LKVDVVPIHERLPTTQQVTTLCVILWRRYNMIWCKAGTKRIQISWSPDHWLVLVVWLIS